MYSGAMTDENIRSIFQGAGDFIARELMCSGLRLYAYMIDGLVSGSDASEYIVRPISEHLQGQTMEELYDLAELFKVFGDTTRIRILYGLFEAEMCVCDIAEMLSLTPSAISHQLKLLKQFRLVKSRREGKTVYYSLADDHVRSIIDTGREHIEE